MMHGKEPPLDEVRLMRPVQPDRDISLAHGKVQVLVDEDKLHPHLRVHVQELSYAARHPCCP